MLAEQSKSSVQSRFDVIIGQNRKASSNTYCRGLVKEGNLTLSRPLLTSMKKWDVIWIATSSNTYTKGTKKKSTIPINSP